MAKEYFSFTGKIPFEGKDSKNVMAFHYYEPEKVVMGKKMKEYKRREVGYYILYPSVQTASPRITRRLLLLR